MLRLEELPGVDHNHSKWVRSLVLWQVLAANHVGQNVFAPMPMALRSLLAFPSHVDSVWLSVKRGSKFQKAPVNGKFQERTEVLVEDSYLGRYMQIGLIKKAMFCRLRQLSQKILRGSHPWSG